MLKYYRYYKILNLEGKIFLKEIKIENLSHSIGTKTLFNAINFSIMNEEKVGLIGRNGNGKSTFLKILASALDPDKGTLTKPSDYQVGYLNQEPDLNETQTVLQTVFEGNTPIMNAVRKYEELLIKLSEQPDDEKIQKQFTKAQQAMDTTDAWNADASAKRILSILGIQNMNQIIGSMSGGQQKRVALAQVLIQTPDLLILDEPTNHLDFEMIRWLENYLTNYKGALLMVTHDRYFLDRVVDKIVELEHGALKEYSGSYQQYVVEKAEREELEASARHKNQQLFKQELAWMREGVRARGTKQKARIERFENLKSKVSQSNAAFGLNIDLASQRLGKQVFKIKNASYSIKDKVLLDDFDYIVQRHDRIGITGANGSGKSTLLNILTGKIELDSGDLVVGETVKIGYYQQDNMDIPGDKRVINYLQEVAEEVAKVDGSHANVSQLLEQFMFPRTQHGAFIRSLSGGEKRRLYLVRLLMERPNVLLLDEPSNNLDIDTLNVLEEYIENFPGAVIVVSHDRYFLDKITDKLLVFEGQGEIIEFFGTADEYFKQAEEKSQQKKADKKIQQTESVKKVAPQKKVKARLSYMEEKEWATIEDDIMELEMKIEEIDEQIIKAGSDYGEVGILFKDKTKLQEILDKKYSRWEYLSEFV